MSLDKDTPIGLIVGAITTAVGGVWIYFTKKKIDNATAEKTHNEAEAINLKREIDATAYYKNLFTDEVLKRTEAEKKHSDCMDIVAELRRQIQTFNDEITQLKQDNKKLRIDLNLLKTQIDTNKNRTT